MGFREGRCGVSEGVFEGLLKGISRGFEGL